MANTNVDLHFADQNHQVHAVRALTIDGQEWHLSTEINGQPFTKTCSNWQSVERTLSWLRRHGHEDLAVDTAPPARERRSGSLTALVASLLLVVAGVAAGFAQDVTQPGDPAAAFVAATRDYAAMHRRLEAALGPITVNANPESIQRAIRGMAEAIRAARPDARPGDFFTPALAAELRPRLNSALLEHGFTASDVRMSERLGGVDPAAVVLRVNGTFPWIAATAMFPCLIEALPPLPSELQYRIVGNDLVLIDIHASLIVDILTNALADMTARVQR